jgi:glyoxylase-like metal-dependent hydrolase (beta-lactamase superfamily II)
MSAAGVDHSQISTILVSHFHPDHVWGLMEKGINRAVFPNAELIVNGALASGSLRQPAIPPVTRLSWSPRARIN